MQARLLPGALEGSARIAGLSLTLSPGWKTYWRAPGEAGVPPRLDWSRSRNLASLELLWPKPDVFESFGLTTIGYTDDVVLPVRLLPEDPASPIALDLDLELGVCREICVFETARISALIAPTTADGVAEVAAALAARPAVGAAAGVEGATCTIRGAGAERRFDATLTLAAAVEEPIVVVEGPAGAWFYDTAAEAHGREIAVAAALSLPDGGWISRGEVRMTVLADDYAADIRGCTAPRG